MRLIRDTLAAIPLACLAVYWLALAVANKRRAEHANRRPQCSPHR